MSNRLTSLYEPLSTADVFARFPTLTQTGQHDKLTAKYRPISTADVVNRLTECRLNLHDVTVMKVKDQSRVGFEKHVLRFRGETSFNDAESPEVILINSHDGACSWEIGIGIIRFICANGLIMGSRFSALRVRHVGNGTLDKVTDATVRMVNQFDTVWKRIGVYKSIMMDENDVRAFTEEALRIRLGADKFDVMRAKGGPMPTLDRIRRAEDSGSDLWTVYNRVQENAINPRSRSGLRAVKGIDSTVRINRELADLADNWAERLAA